MTDEPKDARSWFLHAARGPRPQSDGRTDHPGVESLDAYADGDRRDLTVDRHVHGCHDCAEAVSALRQVRSDLARLATVTMPDDVAGRIRAALAADAARAASHGRSATRSSGAADARPVGARGGSPQQPTRRTGAGAGGRGGWRPRHVGSPRDWLVAAACLAVVIAIGIVAIDSSPDDAATASLAAGSTSEGVPQTQAADAAGRDYAADEYAASGQGGMPSPVTAATPGDLPTTTVSASDEVLMDSEFADHAGDVLAERTDLRVTVHVPEFGGFVFDGATGIPDDAWAVLTSRAAALCYHGLATRTGGGVLAVDRVRYRNNPALFVLLTIPDSPRSVVVVVVGAGCAIDSSSSSLIHSVTINRS